MFTIEQLVALGADIVAGFVNYKGETVSGTWSAKGFIPAEGSALDGVTPEKVKTPATPKASRTTTTGSSPNPEGGTDPVTPPAA